MKTKLFLFIGLTFFLISGKLISQTISILPSEIEYEKQLRPCLLTEVDPEPTDVKKAWSKYLDKNYKVDVSGIGMFSNKDLLTAQDITISAISDKRINLYARILEKAKGTEIKLFASFGYDFFIGAENYPAEYEKLKSLLNNFLMQYLTEYYKDNISETSKQIEKNSKEKVKLLKSIEKNKSKIENAKSDVNKLNAKKPENSEESIKILEKINKLTKVQLDLENENTQSNLSIQEIDKKLELLKTQMDNLVLRQNGLLNK